MERMRFSSLEGIKIVAVVTFSFLKAACVSDDGAEDNGTEGVVVERAFTVSRNNQKYEVSGRVTSKRSRGTATFIRQAVCKDSLVQKRQRKKVKNDDVLSLRCLLRQYSQQKHLISIMHLAN